MDILTEDDDGEIVYSPIRDVPLHGKSGKILYVGLIEEDYPVQQTASGDQYFVPVYDDRYLLYIVDWIKNQIRKGFDVVIMITGERRIGKSMLSLRLAQLIDPNVDERIVAFRIPEFKKILADNPRADPENGVFPQAIQDEAGFDMFKGDFMLAICKMVVKTFEVIGEKGEIVYLNFPHPDFLNPKLGQGIARIWIDIDFYKEERGYFEIREGKRNKWQINRFWNPWAACLYNPMDESTPLWKRYVVKKRKFIDEILAEEEDGTKASYRSKQIEQRDAAIRLAYKSSGLSHSKLAQELDMKTPTVSRVLSRAGDPRKVA